MSELFVKIIIPNFNGRKLLAANLPSVLRAAEKAGAEVTVADDASADDSVEWLRENAPDAAVLTSEVNLGFLGNCNRAVRLVSCDIIILLNSDVEVDENFIAPLLEHFKSSDEVFAVSPAIHNQAKAGRDGAVNYFTFQYGMIRCSYPCLGGQAPPNRAVPIGYACGGAAAIDREKFLELGGFDPLYRPGYWEDVDLGYQAWKRGWRVVYEPGSVVRHQHQQTMKSVFTEAEIGRALTERQLWFNWKNLSDRELIAWHAIWLPRLVASHLRHRRWIELLGLGTAWGRFGECLGRRSRLRSGISDQEVMRRCRPELGQDE